jgi:lysophospholipase L1-like esterase
MTAKRSWLACVAGVLLLTGQMSPAARADQLLADAAFTPGKDQPTLAAWRIDPAIGGAFALGKEQDAGVLVLTGERRLNAEGQQEHVGRLMQSARVAVVPGRRYTLSVDARGDGELRLAAVTFADKYSPIRRAMPSETFKLTTQWQTFRVTFTPPDDAMYLSAAFDQIGWLCHADLRTPSLQDDVQAGQITVAADDFVYAPGQPVKLGIKTDYESVKLLVYGPGGVGAGPGGAFGGSDAWVDHFQSHHAVKTAPGAATEVSIELPPQSRTGFYRVLAVDQKTGQTASAHFCLFPAETASEFRSLSAQTKVPANATLVFLGDSLTDFYRTRNYVDLVERALQRKHGPSVRVFNAGIGGNNINQINGRLERDVLSRKPTHVFLFEGANDSKRHFNPQTGVTDRWAFPKEEFVPMYRQVLTSLKATGAQVVVMTMAPGDMRILEPFQQRARDFGKAMNFFCLPETAAEVVAIQKQLAGELQIPVIDTHAHLTRHMEQQPNDWLMVDDGVHLSESGNREVALAVLRYLAGQ